MSRCDAWYNCFKQNCKPDEEQYGMLCYPKCRSGYSAVECCMCVQNKNATINLGTFGIIVYQPAILINNIRVDKIIIDSDKIKLIILCDGINTSLRTTYTLFGASWSTNLHVSIPSFKIEIVLSIRP